MSDILIISILQKILELCAPLFYTFSYVLTLPNLLIWEFKDFVFQGFPRQFYLISIYGFFQTISLAILFNVHTILFFKYYLGVNSIFWLVFSFILVNIFYFILYKFNGKNFRFDIIEEFGNQFRSMNYSFLGVFMTAIYILSFGNHEVYMFLCMTRYYSVFDMWAFFFMALFEIFVTYSCHILVFLHIFTPLSLMRIIPIVSQSYGYKVFGTIFLSALYIFVDILLVVCYSINSIFFISFVKGHVELCDDYQNGEFKYLDDDQKYFFFVKYKTVNGRKITIDDYKNEKYSFSRFDKECTTAKLYQILKYRLILRNFYKNTKFIFAICLAILPLIFIWRAHKTIKSFIEFVKHKDLYLFSLKIGIGIIDGLLEMILPVVLIYNHINPINLISLYTMKKYYDSYVGKEYKSQTSSYIISKIPYSFLNYYILIQKGFDLPVTIFGLSVFFSYFHIITNIGMRNPRYMLISTFMLVYDSEEFIHTGNFTSRPFERRYNPIHNEMSNIFFKRRISMLAYIISNLISNFLIIFSSISLFNPFYGLKYIKMMFSFTYTTLYDIDEKKIPIISTRFFDDLLKCAVQLVADFFIVPLKMVLVILMPWNIIKQIKFCYFISFSNPINKMRKFNMEIYEKTKKNVGLNKKHLKNLIELIKDFIALLIYMMKFILLHLSIVRACLFWRNYFKNRKLPEQRDGEITSQKNSKILMDILDYHLSHLYFEFVFYPVLLIIFILTPWAVSNFSHFFIFRENKFKRFKEIIIKFKTDLVTEFLTFFYILSIFKTYTVLNLIYYTFRKKIQNDRISEMLYDRYYKSNYAIEIRNMSGGLFKNILICLMFMLNMILITRIISVLRRVKAFINRGISENISRFRHMFDPKLKNIEHHTLDTLSSRVMSSITEYLPPGSLFNLMLTNKNLYEKSQMNIVWENMYFNYYKKKLKHSENFEIINLFNSEVTDYRRACSTLSQYSETYLEFTESHRDSLIGLYNVMVEETCTSLMRVPHLILIPGKILSIPIIAIGKFVMNAQMYFYKTQVYQEFFSDSYMLFNSQDFDNNYHDESNEMFFYNSQVMGIYACLKILLVLIINLLCMPISVFVIAIKAISLTRIRVVTNLIVGDYSQKIANLNNSLLVWYQYLLTVLFCILHLWIILTPYRYNHNEGWENLKTLHFGQEYSASNNTTDLTYMPSFDEYYLTRDKTTLNLYFIEIHHINPIINIENYYNFFTHAFSIYWNKGILGRHFFFVGPWGTNLLFFSVHWLFCLLIKYVFQNSYVFIYDLLYNIFSPGIILAYVASNFTRIIINFIFPHVIIIRALKQRLTRRNNLVLSAFTNLFVFIAAITPFYLNFKLSLTLWKFLMINIYGIVNMIIISV